MAIQITASVGRAGTNRRPDVRRVQRLLTGVFPALPLEATGECDAKTIRRIERFQRRFMATPDGRVDPNGRTIKRLNLATPGLQPDWSGKSQNWSKEKKLRSLDRQLRPRVEGVLAALETQGFKPKVYYAWRSVAVQLELFEAGNSKVKFSFHNARKKDGTPRAYAADIIDRRYAWQAQAKTSGFWDALGRAARDEGLYWGGNWTTFKDLAHVQRFPNTKLADVKKQSGLA